MLRETTPPDFLDSSVESNGRAFSEIWGTFLLVVVASSVVATKSGGAVTLGMAVVAPGLTLSNRPRLIDGRVPGSWNA